MTKPTRDIALKLWLDHLKIEGPRHWSETNLRWIYPQDIITHEYHEEFKIADGITAKYYNAGHILGATQILLDWDGHLILYTGDINDRVTPLFDGFEIPPEIEEVDTFIIESTNGKRYVPERKKIDVGLKLLTKQTVERRNKMLLPSFAVGRSQELISTFALDPEFDSVPIYVDGMINTMNEITEKYLIDQWVSPRFLDELKEADLLSPFRKNNIINIYDITDRTHDFREYIAKNDKGLVIITTSGMLEGGAIHSYLEYCGGNENNVLGFTGYQVEGTTGRQLYDGDNQIELFEGYRHKKTKDITVKTQIMKFPYSGHSSAEGLAEYIKRAVNADVFLVHGEPKNQKYIMDLVSDYSKPKTLDLHKKEVVIED